MASPSRRCRRRQMVDISRCFDGSPDVEHGESYIATIDHQVCFTTIWYDGHLSSWGCQKTQTDLLIETEIGGTLFRIDKYARHYGDFASVYLTFHNNIIAQILDSVLSYNIPHLKLKMCTRDRCTNKFLLTAGMGTGRKSALSISWHAGVLLISHGRWYRLSFTVTALPNFRILSTYHLLRPLSQACLRSKLLDMMERKVCTYQQIPAEEIELSWRPKLEKP